MTSRRNFLTLLGAGAAATLVGCDARAPRLAGIQGAPDVLLVDTTDGLAVLRGGSVQAWGPAVVSPDGRAIFATRAVGADTELRTISVNTGLVTGSVHLPGRWSPSAAGPLGIALVEGSDSAYPPTGRDRTSVLIVSNGTTHRLDLAGNYAPDAFGSDGASLFVLDWLPSTAPEHYRVREVNLSNGAVSSLYGRDKQPIPPEDEEQMRGVRRNAVLGNGDEVLYTLYTHQPAPGEAAEAGWSGADNAFIHTLHLVQHWAYCVDLPAPFGLDPNSSHAIAIEPGGTRLFVVDAAAGKLAVVGTESLEVQQVVDVPKTAGSAYATVAAGTLFIAVGTTLIPVGHDLKPGPARELPAPASGLVSSVDGRRVYVGLPGAVEWYDTTSRDRLGRVPVNGLTGVRQVA